ncbi:unnamed protein product [Prorocentrum cordatum]|uniref:Uncharacterized protein n=1 Tax=Prorocentrum cordatum TaxID=2364126 RepID=A0ABN9U2S8_9DINO|nr:unnamed protein product [Polarella glacialis]
MSFLLLCWGLLAIRTISLIAGTYNPLRANSEDRLGEIVRRTTSFDSVCLVGAKVKATVGWKADGHYVVPPEFSTKAHYAGIAVAEVLGAHDLCAANCARERVPTFFSNNDGSGTIDLRGERRAEFTAALHARVEQETNLLHGLLARPTADEFFEKLNSLLIEVGQQMLMNPWLSRFKIGCDTSLVFTVCFDDGGLRHGDKLFWSTGVLPKLHVLLAALRACLRILCQIGVLGALSGLPVFLGPRLFLMNTMLLLGSASVPVDVLESQAFWPISRFTYALILCRVRFHLPESDGVDAQLDTARLLEQAVGEGKGNGGTLKALVAILARLALSNAAELREICGVVFVTFLVSPEAAVIVAAVAVWVAMLRAIGADERCLQDAEAAISAYWSSFIVTNELEAVAASARACRIRPTRKQEGKQSLHRVTFAVDSSQAALEPALIKYFLRIGGICKYGAAPKRALERDAQKLLDRIPFALSSPEALRVNTLGSELFALRGSALDEGRIIVSKVAAERHGRGYPGAAQQQQQAQPFPFYAQQQQQQQQAAAAGPVQPPTLVVPVGPGAAYSGRGQGPLSPAQQEVSADGPAASLAPATVVPPPEETPTTAVRRARSPRRASRASRAGSAPRGPAAEPALPSPTPPPPRAAGRERPSTGAEGGGRGEEEEEGCAARWRGWPVSVARPGEVPPLPRPLSSG